MNKLMITIIYLSVILFASCQSQNDVQKAINKYMNENAYNPKSYNSIELKLNSYITLAESFDCHIQSYKEEIRGIEKEIDRMKEFNKSFSDTFYKESEFTEKNTELKKQKSMLNGTQKLKEHFKDSLGMKYLYTYYHKYRANNALNAPVLYESYVQFNENQSEIVKFATSYEEQIRCPRFPGYFKLVEKVYDLTQ